MKIVFDGVIYEYQSRGGISRIFTETIPRMCMLDPELEITLLKPANPQQQLPMHSRIRYCRIPNVDKYLRRIPLVRKISSHLNRFLFDHYLGDTKNTIWHSTYYTEPPVWDGFKVLTIADLIYDRYPNFFKGTGADRFRALQRECAVNADAVICISESTRQDVLNYYGVAKEKVHTVHLACGDIFRRIKTEDIDNGLIPARKPFLLYVGGRDYYKNFSTMAKAYSQWTRKDEVDLVIVGSALTSEESCFFNELDIGKRVYVMTGIDDEFLCCLYNKAVGFVYPSLYEGFGIPLLEAMSCGCPIIASKIPSTLEIAGESCVYFEAEDVHGLVEAFETVYSRGRELKCIQTGFETAVKFSWDKSAAKTLEIYKSFLG